MKTKNIILKFMVIIAFSANAAFAISSNFDAGVLTVTDSNASGTIVISCVDGLVDVSQEGQTETPLPDDDFPFPFAPVISSFPCSDVTKLIVNFGGSKSNVTLRLTAMTKLEFSSLNKIKVNFGSGNDELQGSEFAEDADGKAGNDTLRGEGGNDKLNGNSGNDTLYGGLANDTLLGGSGNDTLYGEEGVDNLKGESGNDVLYGGPARDTLSGGSGKNTVKQ